ncbi:hypothetical protein SAMN04487820_107194 [Actinopolyspora mzabensis]|uniref:Uncharacterized protein n=1 Tax=Actinopolyspora mzabensis TaxID=995066 RepID=A0A1G9BJT3_ACTMZ|nr:hypothetical protein SAMN04487820_107194 [Actinopolyspora mzabensis]
MQLLDVVVEPNPGPNHKQLGKRDVDHPPDSDHSADPAVRRRSHPRRTRGAASAERKRHSHEHDEHTRTQGRSGEQGRLDEGRTRSAEERLTAAGHVAPTSDCEARRSGGGDRAPRAATTGLGIASRPNLSRTRGRGSTRGRRGKIPRPAIFDSAASDPRPAFAVLDPPGNPKHRHRDSPYESSVSTARALPTSGNRASSPAARAARATSERNRTRVRSNCCTNGVASNRIERERFTVIDTGGPPISGLGCLSGTTTSPGRQRAEFTRTSV